MDSGNTVITPHYIYILRRKSVSLMTYYHFHSGQLLITISPRTGCKTTLVVCYIYDISRLRYCSLAPFAFLVYGGVQSFCRAKLDPSSSEQSARHCSRMLLWVKTLFYYFIPRFMLLFIGIVLEKKEDPFYIVKHKKCI